MPDEEILCKCQICGADIIQETYHYCDECKIVQCNDCIIFEEVGSKITIKCGKQTSWNRQCSKVIGYGSALYQSDEDKEKLT